MVQSRKEAAAPGQTPNLRHFADMRGGHGPDCERRPMALTSDFRFAGATTGTKSRMSQTEAAADGRLRCRWCLSTPEYLHYHDTEWGFPVADDRRLFEKLCLEGFQSGLSWRTILTKRENFRAAFDGFDFHVMANYGPSEVARLLADAGIVRHRGKIEAVIHNARCAEALVAEAGSLASYFWRHEPVAETLAPAQTVSVSPESIALSKDLKKRGWKFVGPTTVYAFMQAMGLVNDHAQGCVTRAEVETKRAAFQRPV
jgi:DNA-3-methyladenine glycosylase I